MTARVTPRAIARAGDLTAQTSPPEVPAGLPSDLLERRPDVHEAAATYEAANARDFPVVQALALFVTAAIVVMNLLIDIAYAYIDPRVRLGEKAAA